MTAPSTVLLESGGSGERDMWLYMYPNTDSDEDECENAMRNALSDMANQLIGAGAIDEYYISIDYTHPNVDAPDVDTAFSNFGDYLDQYSCMPRGAHVLVADTVQHGKADDGTPNSASSFNTWNKAVMGTGKFVKEFYKNGIVQETLHTFISTEDPEVYLMGDHGSDSKNQNTEHDFGKVYAETDKVSPMASGYVGEHTDHGNCNSTRDSFGYDLTLTDCTSDAVDWIAYVLFG